MDHFVWIFAVVEVFEFVNREAWKQIIYHVVMFVLDRPFLSLIRAPYFKLVVAA